MLDIAIDPAKGRIFKSVTPNWHKDTTLTEYHYVTQTMHLSVIQYEHPPNPKRENLRWFSVRVGIDMIDKRGGIGNSYEWALSAYGNPEAETTAEDMLNFLSQISQRENERTMGIKQPD
jgi:hypothetical protein